MSIELVTALPELQRLQHSSLFLRDLFRHDLQELVESANLKMYPAQATVFRAGEFAEHFYLLLGGVWKLTQTANHGCVANLAVISAGQVVCAHAVLGVAPYRFTAVSIVPSRVLIWPAPTLRMLAKRIPNFAWNVCEILTRSVFELADRCREVLTENVAQRIAHTLIRLGEQLGRKSGSELIIDTPLSLDDLASYAGTTPSTMSRTLKRWQREGLLHRNRRLLFVTDLESLQRVADATYVPLETRPSGLRRQSVVVTSRRALDISAR